jgi:hypothetical protein
LLVPERGFGGDMAKIRFVWVVFILGGILVCSARRLRFLWMPTAVYFSFFLAATLWSTRAFVASAQPAIQDYLSIADRIRPGSRLVRIRYQTPRLAQAYGFEASSFDSLFHLDALIAARCRCIDLSDYEPLSEVFPVVFRPAVEKAQQMNLWSLEGPGEKTSESVAWLRSSLPVSIDYVILISDDAEQRASNPDYARLVSNLESGMRLVATSKIGPFIKLYERMGDN